MKMKGRKERRKEGRERQKKERKKQWEGGMEEENALFKAWSSGLCKSLKYNTF